MVGAVVAALGRLVVVVRAVVGADGLVVVVVVAASTVVVGVVVSRAVVDVRAALGRARGVARCAAVVPHAATSATPSTTVSARDGSRTVGSVRTVRPRRRAVATAGASFALAAALASCTT